MTKRCKNGRIKIVPNLHHLDQEALEIDRYTSDVIAIFLRLSIRVLWVASCLSLVLQRLVIPEQVIRSLGP